MRRRVGVLGLLAILGMAVSGCGDSGTSPSRSVTYRVTGSAARVDVTYQSGSGASSQVSNVTVPWTYTWSPKSGDFLYVSAQIVSSVGAITVAIERDGKVLQSGTASGFATIATASTSY